MSHLPYQVSSKDPALSHWSKRGLNADKLSRRTLSESGNEKSWKEIQKSLSPTKLARPLKGSAVRSVEPQTPRIKLDKTEFKNQWVMARIIRKDSDGVFLLAAANPKRHRVTRIGHFVTKQIRVRSGDSKVESMVVPFDNKVKGKKVLVEQEISGTVVFGTAKGMKQQNGKVQLTILSSTGARHIFDIQKLLDRRKLNLLSEAVYNHLKKNPGEAKCVIADDKEYMPWCGDDPGAGGPFRARFERPKNAKKTEIKKSASPRPPKVRRTRSALPPTTKLQKSSGERKEEFLPGSVIETLILSGRCKGLWVKAKVVSVNTLQRTAELEVLSPAKWKVAKRAVSVPFRLIQHVPVSKKDMYIVPISIVQDDTFLCMPCDPTTTVKQLRRDVGLQIGYAASRITFIFRGAKLEDEENVPDGALFCVVSQKGGMTEKEEQVLEEASTRRWTFSLPSFSIQNAPRMPSAPKMPSFTSPTSMMSLMNHFSGRNDESADHNSQEEHKKEEKLPEDPKNIGHLDSSEENKLSTAADSNEDKPVISIEDPLASSDLAPRVVSLTPSPRNKSLPAKKGFSQRALDMFGALRGSITKDVSADSTSKEGSEVIAEKIRQELNALNPSDGELEAARTNEDCLP